MRECELCDRPARMYCESDQASLCWDCDAKVHGANFLVARHYRSLLCRSCQALTPWKASGSRLGPTVSVCERCMGRGCNMEKVEIGGGGGGSVVAGAEGAGDGRDEQEEDNEGEEEDEEEEDGDEDDEGDDEEDGDNQVVPWSMTAGSTGTPPPVASCSSSEESSSGRMEICNGFLKRMRDGADISCSQDDLGCSPSQLRFLPAAFPSSTAAAGPSRIADEDEDEATSSRGSFRPSKNRKRSDSVQRDSPGRLQQGRPSSGGSRTVDFVSSSSRSPPS